MSTKPIVIRQGSALLVKLRRHLLRFRNRVDKDSKAYIVGATAEGMLYSDSASKIVFYVQSKIASNNTGVIVDMLVKFFDMFKRDFRINLIGENTNAFIDVETNDVIIVGEHSVESFLTTAYEALGDVATNITSFINIDKEYGERIDTLPHMLLPGTTDDGNPFSKEVIATIYARYPMYGNAIEVVRRINNYFNHNKWREQRDVSTLF